MRFFILSQFAFALPSFCSFFCWEEDEEEEEDGGEGLGAVVVRSFRQARERERDEVTENEATVSITTKSPKKGE